MNTPIEPNTTQGAPTANLEPAPLGTQEPNAQDSSALCPLNAADPAAFSSIHNSQFIIQNSAASSQRTPHPKSSLAVFTPEQLAQIAIWVQTEKYDKAIQLILEKFGRKISRGALFRFLSNTVAIVEQLEDTPETAAAAAEILQLAANANHKFTEASLHLLEQTAFNLALTSRTRPRDLDLLNRINNIICRSRNTAVRERHATVQEKKTDLRSRELDLKQQILHARLKGQLAPSRKSYSNWSEDSSDAIDHTAAPSLNGGTRSPSPTPFSRDAITPTNAAPADQTPYPHSIQSEISNSKSEMPGSFLLFPNPSSPPDSEFNPELFEEALDYFNNFQPSSSSPLSPEVQKQNLLYALKFRSGELRIVHNSERFAAVQYCNPADKPFFAPQEKKDLAYFVPDPTRTRYLPALTPHEAPAAAPTDPADPHPDSVPSDTKNQKSETATSPSASSALSALDSDSVSSPETQNSKFEIQNSSTRSAALAERVAAYNNLRAQEYLAFDQQRSRLSKYNPFPPYVTQYRYCPCGNDCPCPTHEDEEKFGQYLTFFWSLSPFHSVYENTLRERGLPYSKPTEALL